MKVIDKVDNKLKSKTVNFKKLTGEEGLEFGEFYDGDVVKKYVNSMSNIRLPFTNPFVVGSVKNSILVCSYYGDTYIKNDDKFVFIGNIDVSKKPILSTIVIQGIIYPLLVDGQNNAYKIEENCTLNLIGQIDADVICNNGEMLFIAKGRTITFSAPFDMTDFTFSIDRAGQITIEDGYGDIVGMATENKKLIIFTKNAVFEFNAVGERTDYTLKRIEFETLDVLEDSVKDIGDKIAFISDRKIYTYKGGKISLEQSFLFENNCPILSSPAVDKKVYYVPMDLRGNHYLFRYDFEEKKYNFVTWVSSMLLDGNCPIVKDDRLYKINLITSNKILPSYSGCEVKFDLAKKVFVKVIAYVVGSAILQLKGDKGVCQVKLKSGLNEKKIRMSSVNFSMEILEQSSDFEILEMQVKYKLKGE